MGNLNSYENHKCSYANLQGVTEEKPVQKMRFECLSGNIGKGFEIESLLTLGLAYKAETCTGLGANMTV
jgi:hypothetical protein